MIQTEQEFTEAQIFEALEDAYEDWRGPFTFVPVRDYSDETLAMTPAQFDKFVSELGSTRCRRCGQERELVSVMEWCGNCTDRHDRSIEDDEFDRARKGE
jgi:hypothetical protein